MATARPGWSRRAQYGLFISFLAVMAGAEQLRSSHGEISPNAAFIEKPFTERTLAGKVREVLDA